MSVASRPQSQASWPVRTRWTAKRRPPPAGSENGNHSRNPIRRSVPAIEAGQVVAMPMDDDGPGEKAPAVTGAATLPAAHATISATAPAIEPAEMNRVTKVVPMKTSAAIPVATGASIANTPAAAATPLPPRKPSHAG